MSRFPQPPAWQSEAEQLLVRLRRRKSQWASEPSLHNLSPRTIDELLEIIDREEQAHTHNMWGTGLMSIFMLVACWHSRLEHMAIPVGIGFALLGAIWLGSESKQRYTTYALTETDDIRVLTALILATRFPWGNHPHIFYAIQRLLKQVPEEHVGLLNRNALDRLSALAINPIPEGFAFDYDLALVTLNTFAKIGGDRELRDVKNVANTIADDSKRSKIIHIAQQLVPEMEARLQRQQVPATLLRAADTPPPASDMLLRVAHATTPEPPQQLLRASLSEHPEQEIT